MWLTGKSINNTGLYSKMFNRKPILFILFLGCAYPQLENEDIFFLDMGIMIEDSKLTHSKNVSQIVEKKNNNTIKKNDGNSVYMATSSDMLTTITKMNNQISSIEESFKNKLQNLELENSRLRNQVIDLSKKLSLDNNIAMIDYVSTIKPKEDVSVPEEIHSTSKSLNIQVQSSSDLNNDNDLKYFDESIYNNGIIAFNNENYDLCIKYFESMPLLDVDIRKANNVLLCLSESYESINRYKKALNVLGKIHDLNSDKYLDLVLIKKGIIYKKVGLSNKAKKHFTTLLEKHPGSQYFSLAEEELNNI